MDNILHVEQTLLGLCISFLGDGFVFEKIQNDLRKDDFASVDHALIWEAMQKCAHNGGLNFANVVSKLPDRIGIQYLMSLLEKNFLAAGTAFDQYVKMIQDASRTRKILNAARTGNIDTVLKVVESETTRRESKAKKSVFSAAEIAIAEYPKMTWAIPGLIPTGLTLLAGRSKIGKSFMVLQILLQVLNIRGPRLTDDYEPGDPKNNGLYLELDQSSPASFQRRLFSMMDGGPKSKEDYMDISRLKIAFEWPKGEAAIQKVEDVIDENTKIVVVDTLQRVKGEEDSRKRIYELDVESLSGWQKLAQRKNIAIVVIHHTRKMESEDPFDAVSGSTGLTGTCDSVLVLTRTRNSSSGKLVATSRESQEREYAAEFANHSWKILGDASRINMNDLLRKITNAIVTLGGKATPNEIYQHLADMGEEIKRATVRVYCGRALQNGLLVLRGHGVYAVDNGTDNMIDE